MARRFRNVPRRIRPGAGNRARRNNPAARRQGLRGASNSHIFTNMLDQPLPVGTDLITSRRFEALVAASGTAAFTVSTKALIDTLPGTSSVWDKVQFHRFDIFSDGHQATSAGSPFPPVSVTITNPSSGYFGDIPTGYADSVGTTRRAHVGISMNELFKETWIDSTDTSPLLTIKCSDGTNSAALVQFVCILRSTAGALTGAHVGIASRAVGHEYTLTPPGKYVLSLNGSTVYQTAPLDVHSVAEVHCVDDGSTAIRCFAPAPTTAPHSDVVSERRDDCDNNQPLGPHT